MPLRSVAYRSTSSFAADPNLKDSGNGGAAIRLGDGNAQVIRGNQITGNAIGIMLETPSAGDIQSNVIQNNAGDGIVVASGSEGIIRGNTITGNSGVGVRSSSILPLVFSDNAIYGNGGGDFVPTGNVWLLGSELDDVLTGGNGDDILDGDQGDDLLMGGAGADLFVFRVDSGDDTISDFVHGQDLIDLRETAVGAGPFSSLVITQDGDDAVIDLGDENTVRLQNVLVGILDADDFIFTV